MSSLTSILYATRIPATYQNFGDKREELSFKISNVALRTILSPGKRSDFLLLWSLWRHANSAKNVNHFEFGLCDWIIKQKAHYKPWVTEIARKQAKDTKHDRISSRQI